MEQYIVSALKYRPATFDMVVGQRALTTTLLNAIRTGKLAHAYLFCGPRGVGKTTCARIFAKTINCEHLSEQGDPCGECESCRAFEEGRSMNIHELDAASNNSVDDIRELIEQVRIPPQVGRYKVFIIDEVHMLSQQAFNAFLKTLEEPPKYVIFILATTEKHKILPTILSRCQVYDFARITLQNTVEHLRYVADKEGYKAEDEALNVIAQKADGGMRDALSIFDQMVSFTGGNITYQSTLENLNILDSEYYFRTVDNTLSGNLESALLLLNEVVERGFDAGNFIAGLASHMRDLLVSRDARTLPLLEVSENLRQRYHEQAMRCKPQFLRKAIRLCNDCDLSYRQSRNKRLQVELCLIEMAQESDDTDSAGPGPAKSLKPIFKQSTVQGTDVTAPKEKAQQPASAATPSLSQTPASVAPTGPQPKFSSHTKAPTEQKPRPLNLNNLSIRTQSTRQETVNPSGKEGGETKQILNVNADEVEMAEPKALNEDRLIMLWQEFANSLPPDQVATQKRMQSMTPELKSEDSFIVTAANPLVAKSLNALSRQLEDFMKKRLSRKSVKMEIRVAPPVESSAIYSKAEQFRMMLNDSPALQKLHENFKMELS